MKAQVKNWKQFQHYKDRSPPWVKLHKGLLDDFDFASLTLASKALAPLVWLLASESQDGTFEADPERLAFRIRWNVEEVRVGLSGLIERGFVLCDSAALATCKRDAIPETEGEGETDLSNPKGLDVGTKVPPCPISQIVETYHELLPELPRVEKVTDARKGYIRQRWLQDLPTLDSWRNYFTFVRSSNFLMGRAAGRDGQPPFRADIEFLTKPASYAKIAEEKYHR